MDPDLTTLKALVRELSDNYATLATDHADLTKKLEDAETNRDKLASENKELRAALDRAFTIISTLESKLDAKKRR